MSLSDDRKVVVIVGGGITGQTVAKTLLTLPVKILLINPKPFWVNNLNVAKSIGVKKENLTESIIAGSLTPPKPKSMHPHAKFEIIVGKVIKITSK